MAPSSQSLASHFLRAAFTSRVEEAAAIVSDRKWDWDAFFAEASNERLLPAIQGLELSRYITLPKNEAVFIEEVAQLNRQRNCSILEEVAFAACLLNEAGIEPVLLKGLAYLAEGVYPDHRERYLADADLLIPVSELQRAVQTLIRHGFETDSRDPFGHYRHHHPQLQRPGRVPLELHHRLGLGKCDLVLAPQAILALAGPYSLNGARVRIPCPNHLMTHLILHSQMQHPYNERIWPPLGAVVDLLALERRFRNELDWKEVDRAFSAAGRRSLLHLHLLYVEETSGIIAPLPIEANSFTRLRWLRRSLLRRYPVARYFDPLYMSAALLKRRLVVLRNVLRTWEGRRHLALQICRPGVYWRLFIDLVEGRGR
jgi:Uncharacterised nucleotidyltransferase